MNYRHDPSCIRIKQNGSDLEWYAEGPLQKVWFEEIPPMALISWLYFQEIGAVPDRGWENRLREKAERLQAAGLRFVDFGTRRSFSREVHERVVEILKDYLISGPNDGGFITTSNMHLGQKHDLMPSGTMGHKSAMTFNGVYGVQSANEKLMESWQNEYQGNLGTVLPDTYGLIPFLRDFGPLYARLFDSIRHDSGDPFWFTDQVVAHYKKLKIDPMSKTIIFSDGLNVDRALEIAEYCKGKIRVAFGIGTNLTNDVGAKPLNIVIKLDKVRKSPDHPWVPVVKLSDTPGKVSGDPEIAAITKRLLGI
jgi:nicotinate phosphoribosyltransferase